MPGCNRISQDGTRASWANINGYLPDRIDVIADDEWMYSVQPYGFVDQVRAMPQPQVRSDPQRDYYRLLAVFKGAYDEYDLVEARRAAGSGTGQHQDVIGGRLLPFVTTASSKLERGEEARITAEIQAAKDRSEPEATIKALKPNGRARHKYRRSGIAGNRHPRTSIDVETRSTRDNWSPRSLVGSLSGRLAPKKSNHLGPALCKRGGGVAWPLQSG